MDLRGNSTKSALSAVGCRMTGFPEIDRTIGGLWSGDLTLLLACDDGGKTALALNIAEHIALREGLPVTYHSTHMGVDQISTRLLASIGRISLDNLRTGELSEHEGPRLRLAEHQLSQSKFHIEAAVGWDIRDIRNRALALKSHYGKLGLLVIDSLDYLSTNRRDIKSENSEEMCKMLSCATVARELRCPVIAIMRVPDGVEVSSDVGVTLGDFGVSPTQSRHAQSILAIHRDSQFAGDERMEAGIARITVLQNRFLHSDSINLVFLKHAAKFNNIALSRYPPKSV